ncbi:MAG: hypothetical protein ACXWNN_09160, partial [Candidatus Binataceae bacterium]
MEAWEAKALEAWFQERVFAWQERGPSSLAQLGRAQRENRQSPFVLGYSLLQDGASPESRAAELVLMPLRERALAQRFARPG